MTQDRGGELERRIAGACVAIVWLEVEAVDEELKRIAARVRRWRDDAELTLQELAATSGVSASTIHKIEHLQTVPTISVLLKVAHGLGRKPQELFEGQGGEQLAAMTRLEDRDQLEPQPGTRIERVASSIPNGTMDVWRVVHEPGFGTGSHGGERTLSYRGELIILGEAGELTVLVNDEEHAIRAGDSLHFKTSLKHGWMNRGDVEASAFFFGLLPRNS
jgi:transcriptional regulator with XRE-family HTH domain